MTACPTCSRTDDCQWPRRDTFCPPPSPRLLDEDTAAAYLGVSKSTFRKQWNGRTWPQPHRIGQRLLWDRKLLDRFVDVLSGIGAEQDSWADL